MAFIDDAFKRFVKLFPRTEKVEILSQGADLYAMEVKRPDGRRYLFTAREKSHKGLIGIRTALVEQSQRRRIPIVILVSEAAYLFYPQEILNSKPKRETARGVEILYVDLKIGRNVAEIGHKKNDKPKPIQECLPLTELAKLSPQGAMLARHFPELEGVTYGKTD